MRDWKQFCVGAALGMIYVTCMYEEAGQAPRFSPTLSPVMHKGMIILPCGSRDKAKRAIHLHHWMLLLPFLFLHNISAAVRAFLFVLVIQGLCYDDRFEMMCPNPYICS